MKNSEQDALLSVTGTSSWWSNFMKTLLLCYILVMEGLVISALGPSLLIVCHNTGLKVQDMGFISTLKCFGYMAACIGVGFLLESSLMRPQDKILRYICSRMEKSILIIGVICMSAGFVMTPWIKDYGWLVVSSLIQGIGAGIVDSASNTILIWIWEDAVSPFMLAMHFSFGLGAFLAPFIIQLVQTIMKHSNITAKWPNIDELMISYPPLAFFMLTAVFVLPFISLSRPDKFVEEVNVNSVNQTNTSEECLEDGNTNQMSLFHSIRSWITGIKLKHIAVTFFSSSVLFFYCGNEGGFSTYISAYVAIYQRENFADTSALLVSMFWLSFTIGRLVSIAVSKILPLRIMLLLAVLFEAIGFSCMIMLKHPVAVWCSTVLLGCSMACIFPSVMALPSVHLKIQLSSFATSFIVMCGSLGQLVLLYLLSKHLNSLMQILLSVCVASAISLFVVLFLIPKEKKKKRKRQYDKNQVM